MGAYASVCGRRAGKWSGGGGERLAKRSRSATPPPSRRRKPVAGATVEAIPLATSACGVWPRGRRSTVETERALVAAWQHQVFQSDNSWMIREARWRHGGIDVVRMKTLLGQLKCRDTAGIWPALGRGFSVIVVCAWKERDRGLLVDNSLTRPRKVRGRELRADDTWPWTERDCGRFADLDSLSLRSVCG